MQRPLLTREFHISRQSRELYQIEGSLFARSGDVLRADFAASRQLAQKMNASRDLVANPQTAVKASHISAMGLLDEVLHFVVAQYQEQNAGAMNRALIFLDAQLGAQKVDAVLLLFIENFPPLTVFRGEQSAIEYSIAQTNGVSDREIALEEMLMLWLSNQNAALENLNELFDDTVLSATAYAPMMNGLRDFFQTQPTFGPDNLNLIDLLRAPALAHPTSVSAQLEYVLRKWDKLAPAFLTRLLSNLDFVREDEKTGFTGHGPSVVPTYNLQSSTRYGTVGTDEPELFSQDRDWMPRAVLMAKNAYVWRDQLSKKYGRSIRTLAEIPDEELDVLAAQGFTGLWLIGLWERSTASQKIKQMCGNEDAVASAYSLYDYEIAHDLGGEGAMHNLRERAANRGLRMASDMVPNHMAIDSRWVVEHPDWFVSAQHAPFPTYTFHGLDLSSDNRVGIFLEDHYYSQSDASVVFKRVDKASGETRYIYHGNVGTAMPWNDTSQLNYLRADVREAVIQTILHVARQFPIIRFDAAMTLAKRHYQRLWFPEPGTGGAIPSRAEYGLDADSFNATFPVEFWREVVDRVAAEVPDTLLLAEAFWMMEGYFVRTLGMHRVYNSAFMNMLRDEENLKYRLVLKNTLEFDPAILGRYVNFMNNPDEDTAVEQFGKGGKYFGICTLMATLPGLPMFGHGQLEGFAEKYGMEYQRAYWDETPDLELMARHQREIFPLLKRRPLFAQSHNFSLYDFWNSDGNVNEDVFAYSNSHENERALVVFHNKYATANGWIRTSVGSARKMPDGTKQIEQTTLGAALNLGDAPNSFTIFRDNTSGLEYVRSSTRLRENGLYVELGAYECHVFLDFHEVEDTINRDYAKLAAHLNGRGVPNLQIALRELALQPVHAPFQAVFNEENLRALLPHDETRVATKIEIGATTIVEMTTAATADAAVKAPKVAPQIAETRKLEIENQVRVLVRAIRLHSGAMLELAPIGQKTEDIVARNVRQNIEQVLALSKLQTGKAATYLHSQLNQPNWSALIFWAIARELGRATNVEKPLSSGATTVEDNAEARQIEYSMLAQRSRIAIDELMLGALVSETLTELGATPDQAERAIQAVELLTSLGARLPISDESEARALTTFLFSDEEARRFLGVNFYDEVCYFNRESFDEILWWISVANAALLSTRVAREQATAIAALHAAISVLQKAALESGFQVARFVEAMS